MKPQITYEIECLPEDTPIEGNASAIDPKTDREIAADIPAQLERGNEWAWCVVKVTATLEIDGARFQGTDRLGCCSYASEKDFRAPGGYWKDMKAQARKDMINVMRAAVKDGNIAARILATWGVK